MSGKASVILARGNVWVMSAIACTAFLGGWQIPGISHATLDNATGGSAILLELVSLAFFTVKTLSLCFVVIWLRVSYPRLREDQLQKFAWAALVPAALAQLALTGVVRVATS